MLKEVRLKNFKLHRDTKIEVAPITVFMGPNNSGKSSIFQALLALREAAVTRPNAPFLQPAERQNTSPEQPYLFADGRTVDIGAFDSVVRENQAQIEIGVSGEVKPPGWWRFGKSIIGVSFDVAIRNNLLNSHTGRLASSYGSIAWDHIVEPPPRGLAGS